MRKELKRFLSALVMVSMLATGAPAFADEAAEAPEIVETQAESVTAETEAEGELPETVEESVEEPEAGESTEEETAEVEEEISESIEESSPSDVEETLEDTDEAAPIMLMSVEEEEFVISNGVLEMYQGTSSHVVIPDNVTAIGDDAFAEIDIVSVAIPENVTSIGDRAFLACSSLTSLFIPESVTSIGEGAFFGCNQLTVTMYSGTYAESYCKENTVEYKIIPRQTSDGFQYTIDGDTAVIYAYVGGADAQVPSSIGRFSKVEIEDNAFHYNQTLRSIVVPGSVNWRTGDSAHFSGCTALESVTLSMLNEPCYEAFSGCASLREINISSDCATLSSISGVVYSKDGSVLKYVPPGLSGSYTIPEGVSAIDANAFEGGRLSEVVIPASVTRIASNAFDTVPKLTVVAKQGSYAQLFCAANAIACRVPAESLSLSRTMVKISLDEGEFALAATVRPSAAEQELIWSSSDVGVVTVKNGIVTLVGAGSATVSCATTDGTKLSAQCTFIVSQAAVETKISLDKTALELKIGDSAKLTASVSPENTAFVWSSSNPAVAVVDEGGNIRALGGGIAIISCAVSDGSAQASCIVIVDGNIAVQALELSQSSAVLDLALGETLALTAKILPANATNPSLTWSSSDTSVALVGSDGTVYPRTTGKAVISCASPDGPAASCTIEVTDSAAGTTVELDKTELHLKSKETAALTATVRPDSSAELIWSSSNGKVALVADDGTVIALGAGTALISCTVNNGSGAQASCIVTVTDTIPVEKIELSATSATLDLAKNEILSLTASVTPADATNPAVKWSSSDDTVALVTSAGTVHPRAAGSAVISCEAADGSGVRASCAVTVVNSAAGTTIVLDKTELKLKLNGSAALAATVAPDSAAELLWSSSNPAVAHVDAEGNILACGAGTAVISCTVNNGSGAQASCIVTVTDTIPVEKIELSAASATLDLAKNEILSLAASVTPADATNPAVKWSSSDDTVALVTSAGTVHPRTAGTAVISCEAADGSGAKAVCSVKVVDSTVATVVALNKDTLGMKTGETQRLSATVEPENTRLVWSSSNPAVASVSADGTVTAVSGGVAVISCRADDGSNAQDSCVVTVDGNILVTGIELNKQAATLNRAKGETLELFAVVSPANATNPALSWSSTNPAVAVVSAGGVVVPMGAGTATVTCTAQDGSGKSASCRITVVEDVAATGIELSKLSATLNLAAGERLVLSASILPANATHSAFTWRSSDPGIARVSGGVVTPVSAGTAVISCSADNLTANCFVTVVNDVSVSSVSISETEITLSLESGANHMLYARILPGNATNQAVIWASSDESVAFAASNGVVVPRKAGTAVITCSSVDNPAAKASCRVTVAEAVTVEKILLSSSAATINLAANQVCALTATVYPENAPDRSVIWSSLNESVAVVTSGGLVVPLSEGSATILCTSAANPAVQAKCEITVKRAVPAESIVLFEDEISLDWSAAETRYLQTLVLPSDATDKALIWSSSNEAVATVEEGVVKPVFIGSAVIRCSLASDSSISSACVVTVYASRKPDSVTITGNEADSLNIGETMRLGCVLAPSNSYAETKWVSSNPKIASVDENGLVTALAEGIALISVETENGKRDAFKLTVIDPSMPTAVKFAETEIQLGAGETAYLDAIVLPDTAEYELLWESSDKKIVKVDEDGQVKGVKKGTAEIRVTAVGTDGRRFSDTITVNVKYAPSSVTLNQKKITLYEDGEGMQLTASVGKKCASAFSWESSDSSVAEVDENGVITPAGAGKATITCETFNGKKAKCTVTVSPMPAMIEVETDIRMYHRQSLNLNAHLVDEEGRSCAGEISYVSSHPANVYVDQSGKLTVKKAQPGTAEITLSAANGITETVYVTVCKAPEKVELTETEIELEAGEEYQIEPIIGDDEATEFSFSSSNRRVATVDKDGAVTAKKAGTAKITVRTHNKKYAVLTIHVQ